MVSYTAVYFKCQLSITSQIFNEILCLGHGKVEVFPLLGCCSNRLGFGDRGLGQNACLCHTFNCQAVQEDFHLQCWTLEDWTDGAAEKPVTNK
jgi:hypothetical protein